MSEIIPTIQVKFKKTGSLVIINESDFDETVHEHLNATTSSTSVSKEQIVAKLKELKVTFKPTQSKAELEDLLLKEQAKVVASTSVLSIEEKDGKFIIVNAEGVQQGNEFDTEEAAQTMLTLLGGAK